MILSVSFICILIQFVLLKELCYYLYAAANIYHYSFQMTERYCQIATAIDIFAIK